MKKILAVLLVASLSIAGMAQAALPVSVGTTVTAIQTDGTAVFDLVFPVVAAFVGLTVIIKLFKRFTSKV